MNKLTTGLLAASALFLALPTSAHAGKQEEVREICRNVVINRGYRGYEFSDLEVTETRNGYGVDGRIQKGNKRFEFNCVTDHRLILKDIVINPLGDSGKPGSTGAPAEAQVACAEEADRYWRLATGTAVPQGGKSTGSGMYEVKVVGGKHSGTCTVTAHGDVKRIMND